MSRSAGIGVSFMVVLAGLSCTVPKLDYAAFPLTCGDEGGECPEGFECGDDGRCYEPDSAEGEGEGARDGCSGDRSCVEILGCLVTCEDDGECETCNASGSADACGRWQALEHCRNGRCDLGDVTCLARACSTEFLACAGGDGPDVRTCEDVRRCMVDNDAGDAGQEKVDCSTDVAPSVRPLVGALAECALRCAGAGLCLQKACHFGALDMCERATGFPELSCLGMLYCGWGCEKEDVACYAHCLTRAREEAVPLLTSYLECTEHKCKDSETPGLCFANKCLPEYLDCIEPLTPNECSFIASCVGQCPTCKDECRQGRWISAVDRYNAMENCGCSPDDFDCLERECTDPWVACVGLAPRCESAHEGVCGQSPQEQVYCVQACDVFEHRCPDGDEITGPCREMCTDHGRRFGVGRCVEAMVAEVPCAQEGGEELFAPCAPAAAVPVGGG
jgi:pentatricopeptide repeat protein